MTAARGELFLLSESTDGRAVLVVATATLGTLIHTATDGDGSIDLITLTVVNSSFGAVILTVEWGGVTSFDDLIVQSIPSQSGEVIITEKRPITNGLKITAFANSASKLAINGRVTRSRNV